MKHAVLILCAVLGIAAVTVDADAARRLGGGSNVGRQRQIQPAPTPPAHAPSAAPSAPAQQPSGMSRWLGPLAGLAAGFGLASLFGHGGFGGVVMVLLLAAALIAALRMLRPRPRDEPLRYAGASPPAPDSWSVSGPGTDATAAANPYPAGFDAEQFVRHAKVNFTRLQAAHDERDMSTMHDFMTPQLYDEIAAQVAARGNAPQKTEVVTLDTRVLEVIEENDHYIASVHFSGMIRETPDAPAEPFSEIWHLVKPIHGTIGWVIAGIQQAGSGA